MKKIHAIVSKPWGQETIWALTPHYAAKILYVMKGHRLSLQQHTVKDETIFVSRGRLKLTTGNSQVLSEHILETGESFHIPSNLIHCMEAIEECIIYEVSTPELDDVIRYSDDYGRVK